MADGSSQPAPAYNTAVDVPQDQRTIFDGDTFALSSPDGNIGGYGPEGFYSQQRRILSRLRLTVNGEPPRALGGDQRDSFTGTFVLRTRSGDIPADTGTAILRQRAVSGGCLREDLAVTNHSAEPVALTLKLEFGVDNAQLVDVRSGAVSRSPAATEQVNTPDNGTLRMVLRSDTTTGALVEVEPMTAGPALTIDSDDSSLSFDLRLAPQETWRTSVGIRSLRNGVPLPTPFPFGKPIKNSEPARRSAHWLRGTARIAAGPARLDATFNGLMVQAEQDLGALRINDIPGMTSLDSESRPPAAGSPWFMYLYFRDALLAGIMSLPLQPQLLIGTVRVGARLQGSRVNPLIEEEPGKILNRVRHDPAGLSHYYGSVDATPLFVMAVGELHRWGFGNDVADLMPNVDAALQWISEYGDKDGDGFVEYQSPPESVRKGQNQCWRDSPDSMNFFDGTPAMTPIAAGDVQGYVYGAYLARADIAASMGDAATEQRYLQKAAELKRRFDNGFWLSDEAFPALALDRDKRPLDVVTSDAGHLLWTGIVNDNKAAIVADRLLSPELFTGFGLRTLSSRAAIYNPTRYHNGAVWPHNTAIGVAGLTRYGHIDHAGRLAEGLFLAAQHMPTNRFPELFCGFGKDEVNKPVWYPGGCEPQLWGAAIPPLLARSFLGLEPNLPRNQVRLNPALPQFLSGLQLNGISLGGSKIDVRLGRDTRGNILPPAVTGASRDTTLLTAPLFGSDSYHPRRLRARTMPARVATGLRDKAEDLLLRHRR